MVELCQKHVGTLPTIQQPEGPNGQGGMSIFLCFGESHYIASGPRLLGEVAKCARSLGFWRVGLGPVVPCLGSRVELAPGYPSFMLSLNEILTLCRLC